MAGKSVLIFFILLIIFSFPLSADDFSLGLETAPHMSFPMHEENLFTYNPGFGGLMNLMFSLPKIDYLSVGWETAYTFQMIDFNGDERDKEYLGDDQASNIFELMQLNDDQNIYNLHLIRSGLAFQGAFPLGTLFSAFGKMTFSGYYGMMENERVQEPCLDWRHIALTTGLGMNLNNRFKIIVSGGAEYYFGLEYGAWLASIGLVTRLGGPGSHSIPRRDYVPKNRNKISTSGYFKISNPILTPVFPVLYKYYDDHPIGAVTISNQSDHTLEEIEVSLVLNQYMDAPKQSAFFDSLQPGESRQVDISALFNEEILNVTEGAKVAAEIRLDYRFGEVECSDSLTETLEILDRNSILWDDDQKIAAFVTSKDEEIQLYARNIASLTRNHRVDGINKELQLAMGLLGAMELQGCVYSVDPSSSYLELSKSDSQIDSVQFPRQTLLYKAGDCDDLAVTFNAMLESLGVETAFVTIPGHIYSAVKLGLTQNEARRSFSRSVDLIFRDDGSVWLPVETTLFSQGFLRAWSVGSRQWNEHAPKGAAGFIPTREAWESYEPVAFSVSDAKLNQPAAEDLMVYFDEELEKFINREIALKENDLQARLNEKPGDAITLNRLGVLYARFGKTEQAENFFIQAGAARSYAPAIINLGNLSFMDNKYTEALKKYREALQISPGKATALLGLARVSYELGDYSTLQKQYEELAEASPSLAKRYAFLIEDSTSAVRASDAATAEGLVSWADEEEER